MAEEIARLGYRVDTRPLKNAEGALNGVAEAGKRVETNSKNITKSVGVTSGAVNNLTKNLGANSRGYGQAGIQLQQFVGQLQGGQSVMLAFSQQSADLGFVLGAPLVGAIVGIGASIAGFLLPSLFDSTNAADKLETTLKSLEKVTYQASDGTYALSEEIARLAKVSKLAANAQIALSMTQATQAMDLTKKKTTELIDEFDTWLTSFSTAIDTKSIERLEEYMSKTGKTAQEIINLPSNWVFGKEIQEIRSAAQNLNEELGTTSKQSYEVIKAFSQFKSSGDVSELASKMSSISLSTDGATERFQKLAVKLNELSLTNANAASTLDLLKSAFGDLDSLLDKSDTAATNTIKSLTDSVLTLNMQLKNGVIASSIFETQQKAGVSANSAQGKSISDLVTRFYELKDAISNKDKAEREAEASRKAASKNQEAWLKSIIDSADPTSKLEKEIKKINSAMLDGSLSSGIATNAIKKLEDQIRSLNDLSSKSIFSDDEFQMAAYYQAYGQARAQAGSVAEDWNKKEEDSTTSLGDAAVSALGSLNNLYESGSRGAENLVIATNLVTAAMKIQAAVAKATMATIGGAVTAGAGLVMALDSALNSSIEDMSASIQANQNINMWGEKSNAIAESTEITANATKKLVGINTDMLDALTNLTSAINAAAGIITTRGNSASVDVGSLGVKSNILSGLTDITSLFSGGLSKLLGIDTIINAIGSFFGGSSKVTDSGVKIIGDTIGNLINDTMVLAYQSVSYKKWRWGSKHNKTAFADAGNAVSDQFSLVFSSLADSVYSAGDALGLSGAYLNNAINNFVIGTTSISLKGLSADDQVKEIEAYFSGIFNNLALSVIPWIKEFQSTGEELGTTLTRVASEVSVLNYAIDNLGVVASNSSSYGIAKAADSISELLGGYDKFSNYLSSFIDSFASDTQKLSIYSDSLSNALGEVGLSLPESSNGFYDLTNGINASTAAGQQQIATILSLTDTASAYYNLLDDANSDYKSAIESAYDSLMSFTTASTKLQYDHAQAVLTTQLAMAKMTSSIPNLDDLTKSLDAISNMSSDAYSSAADYAYAQAVAANTLDDLYALTGDTLTDSQQQIALLEQISANTGGENGTLTIDTQSLENKIDSMKTQMVSLQQQMNTQTSTLVSDVRRIRLNAEGELIG